MQVGHMGGDHESDLATVTLADTCESPSCLYFKLRYYLNLTDER